MGTPDARRDGVILPVSLAIAVLLAIMGGSVWMLSRQTYREVEKLDGFLRAVSVGEACFSRLMQRLESKPWEERWFREEPDQGTGDWLDGSYEYLISDAELPNQADLLVRATWSQSSISMYWLVRAEPDSLSPHRRMKVVHFAHAVGDPEIHVSALDALRDVARDGETQREANREWADAREAEIQRASGAGEIVRIIGGVSEQAVVDRMPGQKVPPPGGGGPKLPAPQVPPPPEPRSQPASPDTLDMLTLCREELRATNANLPFLQASVKGAQDAIDDSERRFREYWQRCQVWRAVQRRYEECRSSGRPEHECDPPGPEPEGGCSEEKIRTCEGEMNALSAQRPGLQASSNNLLNCSTRASTSMIVIDQLAGSSTLIAQSTARGNLDRCLEANSCASPNGRQVWLIRQQVANAQAGSARVNSCVSGGGGPGRTPGDSVGEGDNGQNNSVGDQNSGD